MLQSTQRHRSLTSAPPQMQPLGCRSCCPAPGKARWTGNRLTATSRARALTQGSGHGLQHPPGTRLHPPVHKMHAEATLSMGGQHLVKHARLCEHAHVRPGSACTSEQSPDPLSMGACMSHAFTNWC